MPRRSARFFTTSFEGPPELNLAELRTMQDYVIRYELQSVPGVSEVASVGGYVRQYQIEIDPDALRFHDVPLERLISAVKDSNIDVGAKTVESGGMEYVIRGRGFIGQGKDVEQSLSDIEKTVVLSRDGVPVRIRDLGQVQLGPDFRSGAIDLNGMEAVGGIVVMRFGENPREVIERVREKIRQIEPGLEGVKVVPIYDRTGLINETVATLTESLREELIITAVVIVIFLLHIRASIIVAVTLPMAVLMTFIGMKWFGIDANIMSLAGIAIAIGEVADLGIIISENIYQHLVGWEASQAGKGRPVDGAESGPDLRSRTDVIIDATHEVAPAVIDRRFDDDCQLPAGLLSDRPRLEALWAAGLDENLCHVRGALGGGLPCPRPLPTAVAQCALGSLAGSDRRRRGGNRGRPGHRLVLGLVA